MIMDKLDKLNEIIRKFRDDRCWLQFHNPKDLAISISLEAAELLENFQWSGTDLEANDKRKGIGEELADVFIYCIMLSDVIDTDIYDIINKKLEINMKKYPVDRSKGSSKKYNEFED